MEQRDAAVQFLFKLAKEVKRSFECPVILLTQYDYVDDILKSLVDLRSALIQNAREDQILDIVNAFHIGWLQAVQDIENFKKRAKLTPRDTILKAIDFTIDCVKRRHIYFQRCIDNLNLTLTDDENTLVQSEFEIMKEMQSIVVSALVEKQRDLKHWADKEEFDNAVSNEIEELLYWLDRLNDHLALQFSKIIKLKNTLLPTELTKTLQEIIDVITSHATPEALQVAKELRNKGLALGSLARVHGSFDNLQINKVIVKIEKLKDRIARLKKNKSLAGVMALQHKTIFLEDRLESLENIKLSLNFLTTQKHTTREPDDISIGTDDDINIFNHVLPHSDRCHLIEKLVGLWQGAIGDSVPTSTISILSPTDRKEIFTDDLGQFYMDKHGREIYKKKGDHTLYQVNDKNELIALNDNAERVFFYDDCGRYYLTENGSRLYNIHDDASEYMLHSNGVMLKVKEVVGDIEFRYDSLGRYHVDENGTRIYCEEGSSEKYRLDGLGNLEKIRSYDEIYSICPIEPSFTEDSLYLKKTVGVALKTCLAYVVLTLPADPIKHLADRLEKYHYDMVERRNRLNIKRKLMVERERLRAQDTKVQSSSIATTESIEDENFTNYESLL